MASTVALNCPAIFFATQDLYNDFLAGGYTYTGPVFVAGVLANTGSDWSDPGTQTSFPASSITPAARRRPARSPCHPKTKCCMT